MFNKPSIFDSVALLKKKTFKGEVNYNRKKVKYLISVTRDLSKDKCFVELSSDTVDERYLSVLTKSLRAHLMLGGQPEDINSFIRLSLIRL